MARLSARMLPLAVLAVFAIFAASGCGDAKPTPVKARGRVVDTKNEPVADVDVVFHLDPADPKVTELPQGKTDADGYFDLKTFVEKDGAPVGNYRVTVKRFQVVTVNGEPVSQNTLPDIYSRADSSGLTAKVEKGKPELEPLQVKLK